MKIYEVIGEATEQLEAATVPNAKQDAERLLSFSLGRDRSYLLAHFQDPLDSAILDSFSTLIRARSQGQPLQYLVGSQEFCGLEFEVTPAVLIPRPETELLVEEALRRVPHPKPLVVDVGTGSGCIAISLAVALTESSVRATDVSEVALKVARRNAIRHGVEERVQFLEGDLMAPVRALELSGRVDLVLSNPPYVAERDLPNLQREVRDWEPRVALVGGDTGLSIYRRLVPEALECLRPGGLFIAEIGYNMQHKVSQFFASPWVLEGIREDFSGIPRIVVARKR